MFANGGGDDRRRPRRQAGADHLCDRPGAGVRGRCRPVAPPKSLNWELWQGQAPGGDYRQGPLGDATGYGAGHPLGRTHHYFRWWYEYSGGKMTDWGAHHVDIAG